MTNQALINEWLAKNGGARRFERGASGLPDSIGHFLRARGFEMTFSGWKDGRRAIIRKEGTRGQRKFNFKELIAFVDEIRAAEGREPIIGKH